MFKSDAHGGIIFHALVFFFKCSIYLFVCLLTFLTFCFNRSIQTFLQHCPGNYRRSYAQLTDAEKILRLKVLWVSKERVRYTSLGNTLLITHSILLVVEQRNPLLQLKQTVVGRTKRRYKRKNASPAKKGASPLKRLIPGNSPAKSSPSKTIPLLLKDKEALSGFKVDLHLAFLHFLTVMTQ